MYPPNARCVLNLSLFFRSWRQRDSSPGEQGRHASKAEKTTDQRCRDRLSEMLRRRDRINNLKLRDASGCRLRRLGSRADERLAGSSLRQSVDGDKTALP